MTLFVREQLSRTLRRWGRTVRLSNQWCSTYATSSWSFGTRGESPLITLRTSTNAWAISVPGRSGKPRRHWTVSVTASRQHHDDSRPSFQVYLRVLQWLGRNETSSLQRLHYRLLSEMLKRLPSRSLPWPTKVGNLEPSPSMCETPLCTVPVFSLSREHTVLEKCRLYEEQRR